jgi:hypothetical protein
LQLSQGFWAGINAEVPATLTAIPGTIALSNPYVTFEANAVLYKKNGNNWEAMSPSTGNFNNDDGQGRYAFYKTDPDKAYDIIIKIN